MYAEIKDRLILVQALKLCRGTYQRAILQGDEAISGATLRGAAKSYSGRYAASARNILARCRAAGLAVSERRGDHGKRIIVIG
jgi:hypothetical protein